MSNTGSATIIAKANGGKPTAVYIRKGGQLACSNHALVVVHTKDYVISTSQHRGEYEHTIYRVLRLFPETKEIGVEEVNKFDRGEWDSPLPDNLKAAVAAAEAKASAYHCRTPYYVVEKEKKN